MQRDATATVINERSHVIVTGKLGRCNLQTIHMQAAITSVSIYSRSGNLFVMAGLTFSHLDRRFIRGRCTKGDVRDYGRAGVTAKNK